MIMDGVFASYISRLSDEYTKIERLSPKAKQSMLADATYITDQLSQLSGVRKMDRGLIQAVEAREVSPQIKENMENGMKKSTSVEVLFDASSDNHQDEKKEEEEARKDNV
jgi:hypothetical protein